MILQLVTSLDGIVIRCILQVKTIFRKINFSEQNLINTKNMFWLLQF